MKRTQIYLDQAQDGRLADRARATGTTKSSLIREAIDAYLEGGEEARDARVARFRAGLHAAAGKIPRLPPGAEYVDSVRAADGEREAELERRRAR